MKLVKTKYPVQDGAPVAIIWRPVSYFSNETIECDEEFDLFFVACFALGNSVFDMRWYAGDPEKISSLYIPYATPESEREKIAKQALGALSVPARALGWIYGEKYEDGVLKRNSKDRMQERELGIICLKICYINSGKSTLEQIRDYITKNYRLSELDLSPTDRRGNEPRWWEILRNIYKHRNTHHNILNKNLATYDNKTFTLTPEGEEFLVKIGFASSNSGSNIV